MESGDIHLLISVICIYKHPDSVKESWSSAYQLAPNIIVTGSKHIINYQLRSSKPFDALVFGGRFWVLSMGSATT